MKNRNFTKAIVLLSMIMFMLVGFVGCEFYKTNKEYDKFLVKQEAVKIKAKEIMPNLETKINAMFNDPSNFKTPPQNSASIKALWENYKNGTATYEAIKNELTEDENKDLKAAIEMYDIANKCSKINLPTTAEIKDLDKLAKKWDSRFKKLYISTKKYYLLKLDLSLELALLLLETKMSEEEKNENFVSLIEECQEKQQKYYGDYTKFYEMIVSSPAEYDEFIEKASELMTKMYLN